MRKTSKLLLCVTLSLSLLFCSGCFFPALFAESESPASNLSQDYHGSYKDPIPFGEELEITDSKLSYTLKIDRFINGNKAKEYIEPSSWKEPAEKEHMVILFTISVKELSATSVSSPIEVKGHQDKTGQDYNNLDFRSNSSQVLQNITDVTLSSPGIFQAYAIFYAPASSLTHLMVRHEQSGRYYYFALK